MGSFASKPQKPDHVSGEPKRSVDNQTDCPPTKRTCPAIAKRKRSVDDETDCPPTKRPCLARLKYERQILTSTQDAALQDELIRRHPPCHQN
ncbi:unnamed protein product [Fusarium langsethiae]|nr:unnamed protein product [Fusarium langsethiae]